MTVWCGRVGDCHWKCAIGALTDDDLARFIAGIRDIGESPLEEIHVLDLLHDVTLPSAVQRQRIADAVAGIRGRERIRGHALVANSFVGRAALTAINWLAPPSFPERVLGEPREGGEWLRAQGMKLDVDELLADIKATCPPFAKLSW
ncbi:MAG: hypothetical protein AB7S26_20890 [Sandaracinaceae bacterium]